MRYRDTINGTDKQKEAQKTILFGYRFLIAGVLFVIFMNLNSDVKTKIQTKISCDYSENLFDFVQQIPYNLGYEKISIK